MTRRTNKLNKTRRNKMMCGGSTNTNTNTNTNINTNVVPVVGKVMEKTGDLVENALVKSLETLGQSFGIDINNPQSISTKLNNITTELAKPENIAITKELLKQLVEYMVIIAGVSLPIIEKTIDDLIPLLGKEGKKVIETSLGAGTGAISTFLGPILTIPVTLTLAASTASRATRLSVEVANKLLNLAESIKNNINNVTNPINQNPINQNPINQNPINQNQTGGSLLKKMNKYGNIIAKRTRKAQLEFIGYQKKKKEKK